MSVFSIFAELMVDEGGNYYALKPMGYGAIVAVMLALLLLGSLIGGSVKEAQSGKQFQMGVKQLVFSAVALALAYVTSLIKVIDMPMGGSVTLLSMLFITLIGYWYGLGTGLMAAIAYGCLQLVTGPYIISLPQMLADYILAFGALGLSGLFAKKKHGMILGYLVGVTGRFVFTFISGMIFFGSYAADYNMVVPVYSFLYNGAYLGLEAVLTVAIVAIPPVAGALTRVKRMAV
ncbi:MAG: energy-coupled thiamine transporter ThiT [Lachnospiraceae bacterium]|jgi:thiamine transporter|nr:energy-coupled thiamine transporter ThiT [Lachnospiraceae bacterium]